MFLGLAVVGLVVSASVMGYFLLQKVRQSAQSNLEIARKTEEISSDTQSLADDIVTQSQKSRYDENLTITLECEVIR